MIFPPTFLFGTATSATQIEGGCTTSDWFEFSRQPGRIKHGDRPDLACDAWRRWEDDVALQRSLGLGAHRMSIEWARIEPRDGEIDHGALDRYRAMLGALRSAAIEPMVTLHHFTLPTWLAARGGVLADGFAGRLARFACVAVDALGDLCRLWITINEPNVLAASSYVLGVWPPAVTDPVAAVRAHHHLLEAHVAAYRALKGARGDDVQVGVAHHLRVAEPERPDSAFDRAAARTFGRVFNDAFALATCTGRMYGPLDAAVGAKGGFRVADARGTQDFFGINYYSRDLVRFAPTRPQELFTTRRVPAGAELSDLGWEIYPEGLGRLVRIWAARSGLPVYITENGLADAADVRRVSFIERHLAELARAIAAGVDVRGYFHWSLLDNFEWAEGYEPRFGLVEIDYATQQRRVRPSARRYAEIARTRTL
ncbi:MAG TPA: family 1 glycosylhydrolase [Polyangiaceae bacterium]|nr:family 1 glycosylhydrolase [Polyangiaceae bacterium]